MGGVLASRERGGVVCGLLREGKRKGEERDVTWGSEK